MGKTHRYTCESACELLTVGFSSSWAAAASIMVEFGSIEFKVPISRLTLALLPFSIEIRIAIGNNAISIFGEGSETNNLVEL